MLSITPSKSPLRARMTNAALALRTLVVLWCETDTSGRSYLVDGFHFSWMVESEVALPYSSCEILRMK